MRGAAFWILFLVAACVSAMLAEIASGAPPDALERAASDPDSSVRICTCVEGPLAAEIEKLRTQVRLLRAEKKVNGGIECAAKRKRK